MSPAGAFLQIDRDQAAQWTSVWGLPAASLADVRVMVSERMRSRLAYAHLERRLIVVSRRLEGAPDTLLDEVLCHELAHLGVYELHGTAVRPHGLEWRSLMLSAGFEPRVRIDAGDLTSAEPATKPASAREPMTRPYIHRCPVCQTARPARRPVPQWRCAACVAAGLEGRLLITRDDTGWSPNE